MMSERPFREPGPQHRQTSKTFRITLIAVGILTILLGIAITWLLLTQDLSKATSLVSLIASILAIVVAPITILSFVSRSSAAPGEHNPHINAATYLPAAHMPPERDPAALTRSPDAASQLTETHMAPRITTQLSIGETQPSSTAPLPSSDLSQSAPDTTQVKENKHFQAGSPLSGDTSLYIERKADREALSHLRNMDYISLIEPRLQGKTSLINRLKRELASKGYAFVICDLTNERFRKETQEEWYSSLGRWVLNNLDFLPEETALSLPSNSSEWQTFLETIAKAAKEAKRRVVIILDELRDMPFAYATPFFTVIRSIYNERAITPSLEYLTFITSGAFNPKELIQDEGVSKFNIDQRIELEDFTFTQVREMVDNLQLSGPVAEMVAKKVYYWTDGQPYLTQKLCLNMSGIAELELMHSSQLTRAVNRLARQLFGDQQYLMRIRRLSEREPKLFHYIQGIANGHKPRFNQALNAEHFRLANIYGVMKSDTQGLCRIRNRVCQQVVKEFSMHIHTSSS